MRGLPGTVCASDNDWGVCTVLPRNANLKFRTQWEYVKLNIDLGIPCKLSLVQFQAASQISQKGLSPEEKLRQIR